MCRYAALVAALLCISAHAAEPGRIALGNFGALRVGMSEQQAAEAGGSPLTHIAPDAEADGCFYASVSGLPEGVSLMFLDSRLARIDVFEPGVRTVSGVGVGTPESTVTKLFGPGLEQRPHAYDGPTGHYLTLMSRDRKTGIRFETDGARVTGYYTGTAEAIQLIEGCQ